MATQQRRRQRQRWLLLDEVADRLRVSIQDADQLCEAREFGVLLLPSGEKRVDAASFSRFLRAHQLGYEPRSLRESPTA